MRKRGHSAWHGIFIALIIFLFITTPNTLRGSLEASDIWFSEVALLALFVLAAGHWVTGAWLGAFTNERNRISLSQTQSILWTVLILSALLTGAFSNLSGGDADPLNIRVPQSLWMLMGISIVALVGTPLLSSRRKSQKADQMEEAAAVNRLVDQGREPSSLTMTGRLIANESSEDARWSDLFEAEEVSRAGRIDMSKVQMTLFTVVVAVVYASAISNSLGMGTGFHEFPALSETMIFLIGISHAGYLVNKVVPEREDVR